MGSGIFGYVVLTDFCEIFVQNIHLALIRNKIVSAICFILNISFIKHISRVI